MFTNENELVDSIKATVRNALSDIDSGGTRVYSIVGAVFISFHSIGY